MARRKQQEEEPDDGGLPYDGSAEEAVIGAMLLRPREAEEALTIMSASDFYNPKWGHIFDAIDRCHRHGDPIDAISVGVELERLGQPHLKADLISAQVNVPLSGHIERYCRIVIDAGARRKLTVLAAELAEAARDNRADASELVIRARERLEEVDVETTTFLPEGLSTLDEFLARPIEEHAPWVIPGMMRRGWRVMIVAGEGAGKSVLLRQVAISAAAGLHPFTHREMQPVRTLVIDLENPDEAVESVCRPMREAADQRVEWDPDACWLWRQESGVDLRRRRDRVELESVLRAARPDLVCFGPIYKSYVTRGKDEEESATAEVQSVLDDLRVRYQFALLMEHHAPHGESQRRRDIRPHGSVRWQRWPELGISMLPVKDRGGSYELGRFRGDRIKVQWPERIDRSGSSWPWDGVFAAGTFDPGRPEDTSPMF